MPEDPIAGAGSPLERRLERIEELVSRLEREDLELDDALRLFEEGIGHVREVRDALRTRELRIEQLIEDAAAGTGAAGPAQDAPVPAGGGDTSAKRLGT